MLSRTPLLLLLVAGCSGSTNIDTEGGTSQATGIVFVGEEQKIVAMDIRGVDDIFILDLAAPPTLNETLLYPDPIPTNSGTADLAGCSKLQPQ